MARLLACLLLLLPSTASAQAEADALMQQMEAAVHQGVALSAQGAGLIAQAGAEHDLSRALRDRGRKLIAAGRALVTEGAGGEGMQKLHAMDLSETQMQRMMAIHRLEGAAAKYLKMLEEL